MIFDFGGVVFRWRPAALMQQCLPGRVRSLEEATAWAVRFFQDYGGDWAEFDRGTVEVPDLVRRIAARTGLTEPEVQRVVDAVPDELEPIDASVALMQEVKEAGHGLYFLSNMPVPYAESLVRRNRFFEWFDGGLFSSEVKLIKPEAAIFREALERFGAQPQDCVFLDDHLKNVEAARRLGLSAIHFLNAADARLELEELGVLRTPRAS